jgi:hypothetical protein
MYSLPKPTWCPFNQKATSFIVAKVDLNWKDGIEVEKKDKSGPMVRIWLKNNMPEMFEWLDQNCSQSWFGFSSADTEYTETTASGFPVIAVGIRNDEDALKFHTKFVKI